MTMERCSPVTTLNGTMLTPPTTHPTVSLIVPVYNEADGLHELYRRVQAVMDR